MPPYGRLSQALMGSIETWLVVRTEIPNSMQSLCACERSIARLELLAGRSCVVGKVDLRVAASDGEMRSLAVVASGRVWRADGSSGMDLGGSGVVDHLVPA